MPLRDHFRPPLDNFRSWEEHHGGWPMMLVASLSKELPARYVAGPRVQLGASIEVAVATFDGGEKSDFAEESSASEGGSPDVGRTAVLGETALWAPPRPTFQVVTELPDQDEYEVRVVDKKRNRLLVAVVEIVSPANKDRPESRRAFVAKCAALLHDRVSGAIIDLVTTRQFNLYGDLLEFIGQSDPALSPEAPPQYASACRWTRDGADWRFRAWNHTLTLGQPLPTLPLWLSDHFAVPLELEASYEETCRLLRIGKS